MAINREVAFIRQGMTGMPNIFFSEHEKPDRKCIMLLSYSNTTGHFPAKA